MKKKQHPGYDAIMTEKQYKANKKKFKEDMNGDDYDGKFSSDYKKKK